MQQVSFQEAVDQVTKADQRYAAEAYGFLREVLDAALKKRKKSKKEVAGHVTAEELLEAFRIHAIKEFGPMAITVLDYWGLHSCEDIGNLVFNLVEAGVFGKTDSDTMDGFRAGYDFETVFSEPFRPEIKLSATTGRVVR